MTGFVPVASRAGVVHGDGSDYCQGDLVESAHGFRGTVVQVQPLRGGENASPVDLDPRFVVTIDVGHVTPPVPETLCPGETRRFAIHSPARSLPGGAVGMALEFQLVTLACDGAHWKDLALWVRDDHPTAFEGTLEVGLRYRGEIAFTDGQGWQLTAPLDLPHHHGGGVTWTNVDAFPELARGGPARHAVFDVLLRETTQMEEWRWLTLYTCALVEVEAPVVGTSAASGGRP